MKQLNKSFTTLVFTLVLLINTACESTSDKKDETKPDPTIELSELSSTTPDLGLDLSEEQVQQILTAYLTLKDALVESNGEKASTAATALMANLDGLEGDFIASLQSDAEHIAQTKEPGHQRDHFKTLSDRIYTLVKSTVPGQGTLYRQYCPMAFNNKGAYWLSDEKQIKNPYFGDAMLTCGQVKETL